MRNKWFKFDAETWLSDPKLKMVSYAAQGLWVDIICLCHISEKYGYLTVNGQKMDEIRLRSCLKPAKRWTEYFQELVENNIIRIDAEGYYYCHKLLKDREFQKMQSEFGKKGGNPTLKGSLNPTLKPESESESERDIDIKESNKINFITKEKFVAPSLSEVSDYIKTKKLLHIDADVIWSYYESVNWVVGKKKMVNWKAAISGANARNRSQLEKEATCGDKNAERYSRYQRKSQRVSRAIADAERLGAGMVSSSFLIEGEKKEIPTLGHGD